MVTGSSRPAQAGITLLRELVTISTIAASSEPNSQMPAFGKDGMLKRDEIATVANYVRSIANLPTRPGANLAAGKTLYADNCAVCHGLDGKGNKELGAPNLTDGIWLFGSDEAAIIEIVTNSRSGVMPAWAGRLDPVTIKALSYYVHSLGGGEK